MKELLNKLITIRSKSQKYGETLEAELGRNKVVHDPRCECFAMIFNKSTLTFEVLNFYTEFWNRCVGPKEVADILRIENGERVMTQTKMFFIGSMSSIEFCAKETIIKLHPKSSLGQTIITLSKKKKIHFSDIIKESYNQGIISENEKDKWGRLIWLRNLLVHNNGIAEKDEVYTIDSETINLKNGTMLQSKFDFFINLVDSLVELYSSWINNLEKQS
jgi:hypothetical protein